jgi:DNA (cytosine-5)-methyltransferase 1
MTYVSPKFREPKLPVGTVAELFAGVGGFRIGLARAGLSTVFSNQWEPLTKRQHASEVYVGRFGPEGHTNCDIAEIKKLPRNVDLLVGGFPCQDYSVAKTLNASKGIRGKKGVLWWEILRLIEQSKPPFVFLENVDRLLSSPAKQRGRDFAIMLRCLSSAGYVVEWRIVNAADYGMPQRRIRIYLVAYRRKSALASGKPSTLILRSGILARALRVEALDTPLTEIQIHDDLHTLTKLFNRSGSKTPFLNSGFYRDGVAYTCKTKPRFAGKRANLGDILVSNREVPSDYLVENASIQKWKFQKGSKSIERTHKGSGTKYNYSEGSMAFPDSLSKPSRTILTGEGGTSPSRFKHIIFTKVGYRRLVPKELERLNGFPDDWTRFDASGEEITDNRRAFFMGNALVIGIIERIGKVIAAELKAN